jgi:hypothetical protein
MATGAGPAPDVLGVSNTISIAPQVSFTSDASLLALTATGEELESIFDDCVRFTHTTDHLAS